MTTITNRPKRGVVFGQEVRTPEGYRGKVTEFDEEGMCKVVFHSTGIGRFSNVFGWYKEKDLIPDEVFALGFIAEDVEPSGQPVPPLQQLFARLS